VIALCASTAGAVRIGDVTHLKGQRINQLTGMGLVVGLNATGEKVYLRSPDANRVLDAVQYGPQANGVTFGRYITSTGGDQYPVQSAPTLGSTNAGPSAYRKASAFGAR
jgi:hypothetical protein